MQAVGIQNSSILDDEPLRQFRFVAFQVTTHSEPNVIISVQKPVLRLASHTSLAEQASTCLPVDPSQAQFQRRNRHAELLHAGKLCLRPGTVKQKAHHRSLY